MAEDALDPPLLLARDRDAYATIRGFFFQAERTVQRWMRLPVGQTLELEAGEDIDIVGRALVDGDWQEERVLEQLKSWEQKITLISGRETLANFCEHRATNPGLNLRFCLTTNAAVSLERSPLFKKDKKSGLEPRAGIEWWRALAAGELDEVQQSGVLSRIRQKLGESALPKDFNSDTWAAFQKFVKEGGDDEWLDFVERFEWATQVTGPLDLSLEIRSELLELGASDEAMARAQYEHLLVFVLRLLCQKGTKRLEAKAWKQVAQTDLSGPDRVFLDQVCARQAEVERRQIEVEARLENVETQLKEFSIETELRLDNQDVRIRGVETNQDSLLRTVSAGQGLTNEQLAIISDGLAQMQRTKSAEEVRNSPQARVWEVEIQIEETRRLLDGGKFLTSQKRLEELQIIVRSLSESQSKDKKRLESRLKGLLAFCAWRRDDFPNASRLFYEAYSTQRDDAAWVANAAFGQLLIGSPEEALRLGQEALSLDSAHDDALSMVVRALHLLGRGSEIESWLGRHPQAATRLQTLFVRGGIAIETRDYPAAQWCAREVRALAPQNPLSHRLFCDAHFIPVQQQFIEDPPILLRASDEQRQHLQLAEEAAGEALRLMEGWEGKRLQIEALIARAGVRELLGRYEEALADCDSILSFDPLDESGHFMKGEMLLHHRRDPQEAIAHLSRVKEGRLGDDARVLQAEAHVDAGEWAKVIEVLEPIYKPDAAERGQMDLARLLLQAAFSSGDVPRVERLKGDLATFYPDDTAALATLAELAKWQGDGALAVELMQRALDLSQGAQRDRARFGLAQIKLSGGDFDGAAAALEPLVNPGCADQVLRFYLWILVRAGRGKEVGEIARQHRGGGRAVSGISEHEAYQAVESGDAALARQLCGQLSEDHPEDVLFARNAAAMWLHPFPVPAERAAVESAAPESGPLPADHIEAARTALDRIAFEAVRDDPPQLMDLAQLHLRADLPDALDLAYRALRLSPGDGDIGAEYVKFVTFLPRDFPKLDAEVVRDECAVEIKPISGGVEPESQTWIITREALGGDNEISPTTPLAQKLWGKKAGERLRFTSISAVGEREWEITRVRSKYVYALNETMRLMGSGVLSSRGMVVGRFDPPEELAKKEREKLRALLDEGLSIEELYEVYALPVAALAQLTGRVVPELWRSEGGYGLNAEGHFFAADGSDREIAQHCQTATRATSLTLDWTALLSVAYLGVEDAFSDRFERLVVPRALAGEVTAYARRYASPASSREGASETARRDLFRCLDKFVRERCEVVEVREWDATDTEVAKTYGRSMVAAVKVAVQEGLPLFADDFRLRNLARSRYNSLSSVGIQWLLLDLRGKKHLSNELYFEAVLKLVDAGYVFIWPSRSFFVWLLRRSNHDVTAEVRGVFGSLLHWKTNESLAVPSSATFLTILWKEQLEERRRRDLVEAALDALVEERDAFEVIQTLQIQLLDTLGLRSPLLRLVLADIAWWSKRRVRIVGDAGLIMPDIPILFR